MTSKVVHPRHGAPVFNQRNLLIFLFAMTFMMGVGSANVYVLALAEIYGLMLALGWWHRRGMFDDLTVERRHYPRAFEKSEVDVSLLIQTGRQRPAYLLFVQDVFPPASREQVGHLLREPFDSRSNYEIHYHRTCSRRRGQFDLGPVTVHCCDPFGLFPQTAVLPVFTGLLVYPQACELPNLSVLGRGTLFHVGQETSGRTGHSEECVGLRDYRPGDAPSRIHWPSSARHSRLIVKEFQETVTTEVVLFLDLSLLTQSGLGDHTSTESIIRAGASVAARAIQLSHLVEVFAIGKTLDHVPLGGGSQHLITILDRMALYRAEGSAAFTEEVEALAPRVRSGATVALVFGSTIQEPERMELLIRQFLLEGLRVLAVPVDERQYMKLVQEQGKRFAEAIPFDELVERLRLAGADVTPLQAGNESRELNAWFGALTPRDPIIR